MASNLLQDDNSSVKPIRLFKQLLLPIFLPLVLILIPMKLNQFVLPYSFLLRISLNLMLDHYQGIIQKWVALMWLNLYSIYLNQMLELLYIFMTFFRRSIFGWMVLIYRYVLLSLKLIFRMNWVLYSMALGMVQDVVFMNQILNETFHYFI